MSQPTPPHASPDPARWALASLALSMLLSSLGTSVANVALPTLAAELGASFQAVQWVVLAYLVAVTAAIVTAGRLGDLFGRKRVLGAGLFLFTTASAISGLAPTLFLVIVARAVQGLGAAAMMALTLALVSELLPKAKTGSAMGLLGTTSAIGTALGPSLGGLLIAHLGWRSIFFANVPLGLVALYLAHRFLPADAPPSSTKRVGFDALGTVLLALTLTAYALAMTLGRGAFGVLNVALLALAASGVGLFVLAEARALSPLVRLAMFRDAALRTSLVTNLLVSTVLMATLVVGPFYLSRSLGLDAGLVGLVMSVGPIVAAFTGVPAGRLVDRLGAPRMTLVGLVGIAGGCAALSLLPEGSGVPGYLGPIVVVTASYGLFHAANNTLVMKDVTPEGRGVVSGMLSLSRNLGLITGASVMGAVFAFATGASDLATAAEEDVAGGMHVTFALGAALIFLALVLSARRASVPVSDAARVVVTVASIVLTALSPGLAAGVALADDGVTDDAVELEATEPAPESDAVEPEGSGPDARSPDEDRMFVLGSGANSLRIMGLLQIAYRHDWREAAETDAFFVRRARLGVTGSVLSRDLRYLLVAELAGEQARLLFLSLDYTLVPDWLIVRAGQFKLPFSRSFITMASQLAMIERPLTVGPRVFGDTADVGVMLHNGTAGPFEYALGVFGGGGAGALPDRVDPLVALRVGYDTEGLEGYGESDLEGGPPRFGIAAAGLFDFDTDGDHMSFASGVLDLILKAYGFSLSSAFYVGARQGGANWSEQAIGHHTQLSYFITDWLEPVVRYAFLLPLTSSEPSEPSEFEEQHDVAGGLNLYLVGRTLRLQTSVSARFAAGRSSPDLQLQSQLSLSL